MATFILADEKVRANATTALALAPKGSMVEIKPKKYTRQQEKYLHVIINLVASYTGTDPEDLKDGIKIPILGFTEHEYKDRSYIRVKSSTKATDEQYKKMIEAALMIASSLNIPIHPPEHYGYDF